MDWIDEQDIIRPDIRDPRERVRLALPHFPISGGGTGGSFTRGEDDSYWWQDVNLKFIGTFVAATVAAVTFSASLAFGYQQQNDEIVPQPSAAEEDYWRDPNPPPPLVFAVPVPWWDDQLPAGSLFGQPEEELWGVYTPPYPPIRFVYLPDPEEMSAGALFGAAEEELWQVYTPPYPVPQPLYLPDPEELPGSLFGLPEEGEWLPTARTIPVVAQPQTADDEIIPQPVAFTPDEDYGPRVVIVETPRTIQFWVSDGAASAPAPALAPDEDAWQPPVPQVPAARWYLPDPEELPAGALFGATEEDLWQLPLPSTPALRVSLFSAEDDLPVAPAPGFGLEDELWQPLAARPILPAVWVWTVDDEIVPQPPAFVPDEDAWLPLAAGQDRWIRWLAPVDDEIPPPPAVAAFTITRRRVRT